MTPKRQRLLFSVIALGFIIFGSIFIMQAFRANMVYFYTPTDLTQQQPQGEKNVRIGGLVQEGSVRKTGEKIDFAITDLTTTIAVTYEGIVPALFREGQGVVVEAKASNISFATSPVTLRADTLLAKHDERYMPKEVADALKESGVWQDYSNDAALTKPVIMPTNTNQADAP